MVRQTSELPAQRRCEVLLLNTNGYPAGQDTKIPVGRIVCDSTFDSYSLHGVNGEDWICPSRSLKSFEDVVNELVCLIKVAGIIFFIKLPNMGIF